MFEDYFMQMLTATALQMVHPLSPILAYFIFYYLDIYFSGGIDSITLDRPRFQEVLVECRIILKYRQFRIEVHSSNVKLNFLFSLVLMLEIYF